MKLPAKLRIIGFDYRVIEDPDLTKKQDSMACHIGNTLQIIIDEGFSDPHKKEALIHELLESLNYLLELGLPHNIITGISQGLFAIVNDNPALVALFSGEEAE
jgi:hypothetical protein